jgi:DHA1 family tetracycline resistance protein-like MFS transporter
MPDPSAAGAPAAGPPSVASPASADHSPSSPPAAGSNRSALLIVFLVVFIDLLGFGIVLPLLPLFAEGYVEALIPGGRERAGGAILGLLMASFSAMQFVFSPIWGRVSDRLGRKPILLVGLLASVVFYALFGYACDLPRTQASLALALLFVARLGAGIAGATIATAQAVIADCTPPERRKHGMALIGAAFGIGFTFGPLISSAALWAFPEHHGATGYTAAGLSTLALLLAIVLMPETRRPGTAPVDRKWFNWHGIQMALRTPALAPVVLTFFLATLGFASFEVTLALFNKDALGLPERRNVFVFAYVGFVLMLTQGFLYRRLAGRLSEATFMGIGIALMAVGVGSLGAVSWLASVQGGDFAVLLACTLVSLTAAVIGFAFLTPSAQALISRRTDPGRQGEILGVNQSAAALARILGPIFGLTLYKLTPSHLLPYTFGGLLVALMLPLMPRIRRGGDVPLAAVSETRP